MYKWVARHTVDGVCADAQAPGHGGSGQQADRVQGPGARQHTWGQHSWQSVSCHGNSDQKRQSAMPREACTASTAANVNAASTTCQNCKPREQGGTRRACARACVQRSISAVLALAGHSEGGCTHGSIQQWRGVGSRCPPRSVHALIRQRVRAAGRGKPNGQYAVWVQNKTVYMCAVREGGRSPASPDPSKQASNLPYFRAYVRTHVEGASASTALQRQQRLYAMRARCWRWRWAAARWRAPAP